MSIEISPSSFEFSELHQRMQFYIDEEILPCCATLIMRGTEVLDYKTYGFMDLESKRPLMDDAIYRMYSNTKLVTSVALMMLWERGDFQLDDPLERFMPNFKDMKVLRSGAKSPEDVAPADQKISIRHCLSHTAGFSYGFIEPNSIIDKAYADGGLSVISDGSVSLEDFCDRLSGLPLAYEPGSSWRYSVATDVCARLVEVLSGKAFDEFLRENIFLPLGMGDTDFWVPKDKTDRFITQYAPMDLFDPMKPGLVKQDDPITGEYSTKRAFLSGGGGLVSTVSDYLAFLKVLVNGGIWNGVQLLKPETLSMMRTSQLADGVKVAFPMWSMPGTGFGLGFAIKLETEKDEPAAALDEYHWGGMAGTHSWMSPRTNITGFCLTQRMPGFWHPFSHEFKSIVYKLAEQQ